MLFYFLNNECSVLQNQSTKTRVFNKVISTLCFVVVKKTWEYEFRVGVGNVRPAGRIRPAEWKRPAPKPFLNLNGIRPADKIDPAREYVIRPARHFKNLYEIRKVNVIITKFEQNLFWIVLTKQNWKTLTLKTFLKMAFYFCGEKTPFCYGMLFWFKSVETILYQITPKTFVCWNNLLDDPNYYIHLHKQWTYKKLLSYLDV